jgi:hypothetical protein
MSLAEGLALVSAGGVVQVVGMLSLHANVIDERDVADLDLLKGPAAHHTQLSSAYSLTHSLAHPSRTHTHTHTQTALNCTHHFPNNFTSAAASAMVNLNQSN